MMRQLLPVTSMIALTIGLAASMCAAERWPGVKVTYFPGADFDRELMTCYERELRFDGWVPLPYEDKGGLGPFSIRWETDLQVAAAGEYTFRLADPAGVEVDLQIAGRPVEWTAYEQTYEKRGKPSELGPYPNALMTVEYQVLRAVGEKTYGPERLVVALPSVLERQVAAPASFKPGDEHIVLCCSYDAQPERIRQWPRDDDIQDLDLPISFGVAVVTQVPQNPGRSFWIHAYAKDYVKGGLESVIPAPVYQKGE